MRFEVTGLAQKLAVGRVVVAARVPRLLVMEFSSADPAVPEVSTRVSRAFTNATGAPTYYELDRVWERQGSNSSLTGVLAKSKISRSKPCSGDRTATECSRSRVPTTSECLYRVHTSYRNHACDVLCQKDPLVSSQGSYGLSAPHCLDVARALTPSDSPIWLQLAPIGLERRTGSIVCR